MTWYYLAGTQPAGPFEETEVERLFGEGTLTLGSRVWRQGLETWQTFAEAFKRPAATCFKCKRLFPPETAVHYGSDTVCPECKNVFFQQIREGLAPETGGLYGGFWIRVGAYLIDRIALSIVSFPLQAAFQVYSAVNLQRNEGAMNGSAWFTSREFWLALGVYMILVMSIGIAYYVFFVGRWGATPGKMALRLKIVRSDFSKVSYWRALARYFGFTMSAFALYLGYIMVAFDSEKGRCMTISAIRGSSDAD